MIITYYQSKYGMKITVIAFKLNNVYNISKYAYLIFFKQRNKNYEDEISKEKISKRTSL